MNRRYLDLKVLSVLVLPVIVIACLQDGSIGTAQSLSPANVEKTFVAWESPAKLHGLVGSEKGELNIGAGGIEFQAPNHSVQKWAYQDIQTFRLSVNGLIIETYQNRRRHMPGVAQFKFDLERAFPPNIAAEVAEEVKRPSQNTVPETAMQSIGCTTIPAHHNKLAGGTNGVLRFCGEGIDYVSSTLKDSRSWRWADLSTLSDSDPYHLMIFGYRDTYGFDLKEPLSRSLFYRSVDALDAYKAAVGQTANVQSPDVSERQRQGVGHE